MSSQIKRNNSAVPKNSLKEQIDFLKKDGNMEGKCLSDCLESFEWGSISTVMYELNTKEMVSFIQNWMNQNKGNFPRLFHRESIDEVYPTFNFHLPYIDHETCPRDENHKETIRDLGGKLRCTEKSTIKVKPSFVYCSTGIDTLSQVVKKEFDEIAPSDPTPDDAWTDEGLKSHWEKQYQEYLKERKKYDEEEREPIATDVCYAIISDKEAILPLETVINRLNVAYDFETFVKSPFDHMNLAFYVQRWWEQSSKEKPPLFDKSY